MARTRKKKALPTEAPWLLREGLPFRLEEKAPAPSDITEISKMSRSWIPAEPELRRLFTHSSEAVVLHALKVYGESVLTVYTSANNAPLQRGKNLALAVAHRGISAARQEGVLWNPIVDRLLEVQAPYKESQEEIASNLFVPLSAWVASQEDPTTLHGLSQARSNWVRNVIPQYAQKIDETLFQAAFNSTNSSFPYHSVGSWISAPALSDEQRSRLFDWLLGEWKKSPADIPRGKLWDLKPIGAMMRMLSLYSPTSEQRNRLFSVLKASPRGVRMLTPILLSKLSPSVPEIESLWEELSENPVELALYSGISPDQARRLLDISVSAKLIQALAGNPRAMQSAEVRAKVFSSRSAKVLDEIVLRSQNVEAIKQVLPRYLKLRTQQALEAILREEIPLAALASLSQEDFLPAFSHPDQSVRLLAIQAASRMKEVLSVGKGMQKVEESLVPGTSIKGAREKLLR